MPVSAQCEANATPCITADTPWQPWVAGMGGNPGDPATAFTWAYHFFWGLEDIAAVYMEMWNQVDDEQEGRGSVPERRRRPGLHRRGQGLPGDDRPAGYTSNNPGLYPSGTQDFSAQIAAFKKNDDQILTGDRCRRRTSPPSGSRPSSRATTRRSRPSARRSSSRPPSRRSVTSPRTCDRGVVDADLPDDVEPDGPDARPSSPTTYTAETGKQWNVTARLLRVPVRGGGSSGRGGRRSPTSRRSPTP